MAKTKKEIGIKVKLIRGDASAQAQKLAWPSVDGGAGQAPAIGLPHEPKVELVNQPEGAPRIVVTCTCGKRIEIACEV